MAQNIATTPQIDRMVEAWIAEGRFANRSEAFRAGIFALKDKLEAQAFDPDFVTIVRDLDRHPGAKGNRRLKNGWRSAVELPNTAGDDNRTGDATSYGIEPGLHHNWDHPRDPRNPWSSSDFTFHHGFRGFHGWIRPREIEASLPGRTTRATCIAQSLLSCRSSGRPPP